MNGIEHKLPRSGSRGGAGHGPIRRDVIAAFLAAAGLWIMLAGCADPRSEPSAPPDPGYTETIVLWEAAVSDNHWVSATFEVSTALAAIVRPGEDTPARLTVAAYIEPDNQILRYDSIVVLLLPAYSDSIIDYLVVLNDLEVIHDELVRCLTYPYPCEDTTGFADSLVYVDSLITANTAELDSAVTDTTELGVERDSLGLVLDDRYTLALRMDDDTTAVYPEAVFLNDELVLGGQAIYLAAKGDSNSALPGWNGRGFQLALDRLSAADPYNYGEMLEVNWTTCFPGSDRPCLSVGTHRLYARVTGANTRVTGTLVLVYAEERP